MKRIKSIDIFRGLSICWMIIAHLQMEWLKANDYSVHLFTFAIMDVMGSCAFLFVSGISTMISYQKRLQKNTLFDDYSLHKLRNEYHFRALIIFIMAFSVNIILAIINSEPRWIFAWQFLQTLSVSLFIAWPLLSTSKIIRIIVGIIFWIVNYILKLVLTPYIDQPNIGGFIFVLFYTTLQLDGILIFFTYFLIGTIVGEIIYEVFRIEDKNERKAALKNRLLLPSCILGTILLITGILLDFPEFLNALYRSFPWMIYSLGFHLIFISVLIFFEESGIFHTKKNYRFLFYFSYYSFTVYATHYVLTPIFRRQLNAYNIWIFIIITTLLYNTLFRIIYKTLKEKASIKIQINNISVKLTRFIEERKNN
jgi:uncharacterized membrane protein